MTEGHSVSVLATGHGILTCHHVYRTAIERCLLGNMGLSLYLALLGLFCVTMLMLVVVFASIERARADIKHLKRAMEDESDTR